jgi:endonuclease YncB( thermonuclease family)
MFKFPNPLNIFRYSKNNENLINKNLLEKNIIVKNYMEDGFDIKWEDTVEFTFPIQGGRVIKVYDADTITIASKLPFEGSPIYRLSVRLNGIDTPEIKGKGVSDEEKEAAKNAREFVSNMVLNKYVKLENIQSEKYGRILADVYLDNVHLNNLLLQEKYAVVYDGGTKKKPSSWLKYRITGEF